MGIFHPSFHLGYPYYHPFIFLVYDSYGSGLIMMSYLLYFTGWGIYCCLFAARKTGVKIPELINSYVTALLCLPLLLGTALWVIRKIKNSNSIQLSPAMVVFSVAYVAIVMEVILPQLHTQYTGDILDVICYAIGGYVFFLIQQQEGFKSKSTLWIPLN